jgi:hypothetical protein
MFRLPAVMVATRVAASASRSWCPTFLRSSVSPLPSSNLLCPPYRRALSVPVAPSSHHLHRRVDSALASIVYTETDEAPALATYSLYPVISKVCPAGCVCRPLQQFSAFQKLTRLLLSLSLSLSVVLSLSLSSSLSVVLSLSHTHTHTNVHP